LSEIGRPPGIPDEAWRRWAARSQPATPSRAADGVRRVSLGDGDARTGPCDLCGGDSAPFSWLSIDGGHPYAVCATCRATIARLHSLTGDGPVQLTV
jgi:hypothetical protein